MRWKASSFVNVGLVDADFWVCFFVAFVVVFKNLWVFLSSRLILACYLLSGRGMSAANGGATPPYIPHLLVRCLSYAAVKYYVSVYRKNKCSVHWCVGFSSNLVVVKRRQTKTERKATSGVSVLEERWREMWVRVSGSEGVASEGEWRYVVEVRTCLRQSADTSGRRKYVDLQVTAQQLLSLWFLVVAGPMGRNPNLMRVSL